ncbi:MAG: hypothetical protein CMA25_05665 [Euryarchaeota archaeon]|nr:hypothetical protein [Euryarchaeota archaeon]
MDKQERFEAAGTALAEARELNRTEEMPILVEGKRDARALRSLGFLGPIVLVNQGRPLGEVIAKLIETYPQKIILLMDWDRTGGRLQKEFRERLRSLDRPIDESLRKTLSIVLTPESRCVEAMYKMADFLKPIIDFHDREGADEHPLP